MSYERAMDPSFDPERRAARQREFEQLELPFETSFSESARNVPDVDPDEVLAEVRKAIKRINKE